MGDSTEKRTARDTFVDQLAPTDRGSSAPAPTASGAPERPSGTFDDDEEPTIEERLSYFERQLGILAERVNANIPLAEQFAEFVKGRDKYEQQQLEADARFANALTILLGRGYTVRSHVLAGLVVLAVEDEIEVLNTIRELLHKAGATPLYERTATQGRIRLEKTGPSAVNCAILDVRLPDSDGTQLARDIRARSPNCGIVLTSGYPLNDFEEVARRQRYILLDKPYQNPTDVSDAVLAAIALMNPSRSP